jgi:glycerate 2-kinase
MTAAAARLLGPRIRGGVMICPDEGTDGMLRHLDAVEIQTAGHPLPDERSERAGRRALDLAASGPAAEALIVLLSGGASAMMAVPADQTATAAGPGLKMEWKRRVTEQLLRGGAGI